MGKTKKAAKGKEFVPFPENYDKFVVEPEKELKIAKEKGATAKLKLQNTGELPVLYKIKCTSNKRIAILDCAGVIDVDNKVEIEVKRRVLEEGAEDSLCVLYVLLGELGGDNALIEWRRAVEQQIPTRNVLLRITD